jgi:hypothetical protein
MNDADRGKIRNRTYAQQIRDFSGLRYGKITPTDIDAFLDFGNRIFVFIESKHGTAPLPYGQRLALERLCDACQSAHIESLLLIASHNTSDDINVSDLLVKQYRYKQKWSKPIAAISVRTAIDKFIESKRQAA